MRRPARRSTTTPATAASTPSPTPARTAGRASRRPRTRRAASLRRGGALRDGAIVAVKGIGGYHLACRAGDEEAVARLRARKHREEKPFALMAPDVEAAASSSTLGPVEAALLRDATGRSCSRRRRDAPRRAGGRAAPPELGVMLPYSPLHHLLLDDVGEPLVMTSGNVSDEPIAYEDDDALGGWARSPTSSCSTTARSRPASTTRCCGSPRGRPVPLRRSRGAVPSLLALPAPGPPARARRAAPS